MRDDQSHLKTLATRMSTSSAMNPALLLCLMVCPLALAGAVSLFHFGLILPGVLFAAIGSLPLGLTAWQIIHFTHKDPDRLQREQHIEKMLQLRSYLAVKQEGDIIEVPVSQQLTGNPQAVNEVDE